MHRENRFLHAWLLPTAVFLLGFALAATFAWRELQSSQADAQADFQRNADRAVDDIAARFRRSVYGLNGLRSVYAASGELPRAAFAAAVAARDLPKEFPGVRGFGFIQRVPKADLDRFVAKEQADGAPQFAIRQLADKSHDDLLVIKRIEPPAHNRGALGLDVGSEPLRRAGAQHAIDTGAATLTGAITLVQDNKKTPGALLFVPVYAQGTRPATPEERRNALVGLVYCPIVFGELLDNMADVKSGLLDFEIYDGQGDASGKTLIFDADQHTTKLAAGRKASDGRAFSTTRTLDLPGRTMTLEMHSTAVFEAAHQQINHWLVLFGGTLISAMLASLLYQQVNNRRRAEALAQRMTADLDRMAQVAKYTSNCVSMADDTGRITWVNEGFTRITGFTLAEAQGKTHGELLSSGKADPAVVAKLADAVASSSFCRVEILNRAKNGREYWVDTEIQPQRDAIGNYSGFMEIGTDVTERHEAIARVEAALRESHALLSALDMHAITSTADSAGRITAINDAFCDISGYESEELLGMNYRIVNSGVHPPEFWADFWKTISTGMPWRGQVCNRAKTGRLYWVDTFVAPFIGDDGQIDKFVSILVDITATKAAEDLLQQQRQTLNNVIEGTNVGTWEWNVQTGVTKFNARWAQIVGYTLEELGATSIETWVQLTHPDDLAASNALLQQHFDGKLAYYECEARMRHKEGHWVWVLDRGKVIDRTPEGLPLTMAGTHMDITARHAMQAESQRNAQLLRGSLEAIDEAFVVYDPNGCLVFCNDKYREVYREVAHLMVPGARFEDIIRAGAEQGQYTAAIGRVDEWVAERLAAHNASNSVQIQRLANGRTLRIIERKLADGHIVGFRIDITELVQATEAAQAASVSKSQFLANMSHEIRTPMNAILGMLTLLQKTDLTTRQADYAAKSEGAARTLLGLINDILDFSKIESGKMVLDVIPLDTGQLARDLSVILASNVGDKPIELVFDIDPAMPRMVMGDALRIQQVLINLCSNAIKFTERGDVVLEMKVQHQSPDALTLYCCVRDSGIGIAPENQARIFSGFTQAEASTTRRFGGTGLGLAISQRFVALMGGELALHSALGEGSQFFFTITLALPATPALPAEPTPPAPKRALVVEDNAAALAVFQRLCGALGWTLDTASSGEQALEKLHAAAHQTPAYDAVFVDWQMEGMDGWQTIAAMRERNLPGDPPIVLMANNHTRELLSQRDDAERVLRDGVLLKPVTASTLAAAAAVRTSPHADAPATTHGGRVTDKRLQGMRLLVVEDNPNNQQVARELLEDEGALVQLASDGSEGVAAVAHAAPAFDVVLMDMQMPVMDGLTAARHIRGVLGLQTLPIVAMTANAMAVDREACLAAGMNEHVGKPFDLNHLVQVLRKQAGWSLEGLHKETSPTNVDDRINAVATASGIDMPSALARMGNNAELYARVLKSFIEELSATLHQLAESTTNQTPQHSARILHTIKGLSATVGAMQLSAIAAQCEKTMLTSPELLLAAETSQHMCTAIELATPGFHLLLSTLQAAEQAASATAPADSAPAASPVDTTAVVSALEKLAGQLVGSDLQALNTMTQLRQLCGPAMHEQLAPIDACVSNMDFEQALALTNALITQLKA